MKRRRAAAAPRRARRVRGTPAARSASGFIVLTGLSGSGKSQAIHALEDLGYFCVDNLPTTLIPMLAELSRREGISRVAIVVDVREGSLLSDFPKVFRKLRAMRGLDPALIFLEATNAALVRRFSETRRPHPMAPDRSVSEGIVAERERLNAIRELADEIIDTSEMSVHELRHAFMAVAHGPARGPRLIVTVLSFGYKYGVPVDSDLLFDVRFLPNPYFVRGLRQRTGRDSAVIQYLRRQEATEPFLRKVIDLLKFLIPHYVNEGKSYLTVGIGCTGGRHRSVAIAEALKQELAGLKDGVRVRVRHRDMLNA